MEKYVKIDYETPEDFLDELNKEFHFTLDPCASRKNKKCNGLSQSWKNESVFMNPPYDKSIGLWIKKAYETSQEGSVVVCLIQGRSSDTKMWHNYIMKASEIRFIKDRLHFGFNGKSARANISSVVVVFRPYCVGPPITCSIDTKGRIL